MVDKRRLIFAAASGAWCWTALIVGVCLAEDASVLRQGHPWGRFAKGAWREVEIVTESFDEQGRLASSSTTDNKTTLEEVTAEYVTLKVEVTVESAGRRFPSQPQIVRQGYAGENAGQRVSVKPAGAETVMVDGREIPCEIEQVEILGGVSREVTLISYAPA